MSTLKLSFDKHSKECRAPLETCFIPNSPTLSLGLHSMHTPQKFMACYKTRNKIEEKELMIE